MHINNVIIPTSFKHYGQIVDRLVASGFVLKSEATRLGWDGETITYVRPATWEAVFILDVPTAWKAPDSTKFDEALDAVKESQAKLGGILEQLKMNRTKRYLRKLDNGDA